MLVDEKRPGKELRAIDDPAARMRLHALDAWVRDTAVLTDEARLKAILHDAARAGGALVVGEAFHVFPNGAVTGVLVLAQSHLSIHTWPEFDLANVDLLSYGDVRGEDVLRAVCEGLGVERSRVACLPRAGG
ncbi:MAG: S-adenosylmethionine decarboxylase family protein [Gaiellaceae bacterium]